MTRNIDDPARLNGTTVIGADGQKLGNVDAVYYDNATDRAEWVAVRGGLFGTRVTLVPLRRADLAGDELHIPFDKVQLKNAPHHDPGRELSSSEEVDLYRYYGVEYATVPTGGADDDSVMTDEIATAEMAIGEMTGRHARPDDAMTRSAERLRVGTTSEEAGRARLRKHVVTEHEGDVREERVDGVQREGLADDLRAVFRRADH